MKVLGIFLLNLRFNENILNWRFHHFSTFLGRSRMAKTGYYAVKVGRVPGIYKTWSECKAQVTGFSNAVCQKFATEIQALEFLNENKTVLCSQAESKSVGNDENNYNFLKSSIRLGISSEIFGKTQDLLNESNPLPVDCVLPKLTYSSFPETKRCFYAVRKGRNPGIYNTWTECEAQVHNFNKAFYCKFNNEAEALDFLLLSDSDPSLADHAPLKQTKSSFSHRKNCFYAVHRGRKPGVYRTWTECEAQIKDFDRASYRKFDNEAEAMNYLSTGGITKANKRHLQDLKVENLVKKRKISDTDDCIIIDEFGDFVLEDLDETVVVFTDGSCFENGKRKARAGIGVYWGPYHPLNVSKRLHGRQTNNRAEIHAAIYALKQAKQIGAKKVKLYTDSQFLIHGVTDWVKKWEQNGWKLVTGEPVVNKEDFIELNAARKGLDIEWFYVRAHNDTIGNTEADKLARSGSLLPLESHQKAHILNESNSKFTSILTRESCSSEKVSLIFPEESHERTFYAVHKGRSPGVYNTWTECEAQVKDFWCPSYRKFATEIEALNFVKTGNKTIPKLINCNDIKKNLVISSDEYVSVYTDGASSSNGKECAMAGIGVFWGPGNILNTSMRLSGRQTNNRAEIYAAVHALKQAKQLGLTNIRIYTDSQFVIKGITEWINNWKINGWKSSNGKPVINRCDFEDLDKARQGINVDWCYVKGHDNNPGNVEADKLAVAACKKALVVLG